MSKLKILYAGSPIASAIVLRNLIEESKKADFEIVGVLTNPPASRGRHKELIPTEVAQCAEKNGIQVFFFDHLKEEARNALAPLGADLMICFDYGKIFGPKFLALFPLGGINLHPSMLPKYRGCTPVPAAILNGDESLGISVQKLALKTDEGDILARAQVPLSGDETTQSLMDGDGKTSVVTSEGTKLLIHLLRAVKNDGGSFALPEAEPQSGESSYTPFIKKDDGVIDWNKDAAEIDRQIRAYTPWPLSSTECNGTKLLILKGFVSDKKSDKAPGTVLPYQKSTGIEIACGNGTVYVATELQWQAKKAMDYKSFMNGARNFIDSVLG
ncbi:MAG: methionyl-tRNA formyltransferase [Treponema sp.]|nr:methionyl-tRNA formyltransferase [Treponema sp.]